MHQGLVWFPTVGTRIITGPSDKELHAGSSVMITTMCYDISDHEYLVLGKQIKTHVHNLRPFLFSPDQVNPVEVTHEVPCSMDRL